MCIKMSDVRLSNASPTLERVDARQPDSVRPSVRRCLFGSPDREELRETFQEFMQEEARRFRDTYNFDPVEDRPLSPGRFQWEVDEDAPEFYRRSPHGRLRDNNSGNNNQRDQVETTPGRTDTERSRKRPSDPSGSSSSSAAPRSKSSRSNGEHEGAQPERGTSRAAQVPEQAPQDQ
ncbi:cyclin-dependent kinase inhibitor 1Ba [Periophthalmus magnuspinnatus]|uniref:cyclin-dependent kinase inhibitor 1Ba n=1 Tax=Periophthalmus magnuspinnatus TaxID=409849 RepID=UPI00145A0BE6|nr:cyclin-dependent kinase inhibitor 1Ba [Periophthalmus magnuspinnatus]